MKKWRLKEGSQLALIPIQSKLWRWSSPESLNPVFFAGTLLLLAWMRVFYGCSSSLFLVIVCVFVPWSQEPFSRMQLHGQWFMLQEGSQLLSVMGNGDMGVVGRLSDKLLRNPSPGRWNMLSPVVCKQ